MDPKKFMSQAKLCKCFSQCECQEQIKIFFKKTGFSDARNTTGIFQTIIMGKIQMRGRFPIDPNEIESIEII